MKRIFVSPFAVAVLWGVSLAQQPTSPPSNNSTPQEQRLPRPPRHQRSRTANPRNQLRKHLSKLLSLDISRHSKIQNRRVVIHPNPLPPPGSHPAP